jgi:hypothetical protein
MRSMQTKVLELITARLEKVGLEAVQSSSYSNIGRLYVQSPKQLHTVAEIGYDFQSTYCSIRFSGLAVDSLKAEHGLYDDPPAVRIAEINGIDGIHFVQLQYVDNERMETMLEYVDYVAQEGASAFA